MVGGFAQQATDWRSLAAMMAGGMTYRVGRMGAMAAGTGRLASMGIGLGAEVTAFEMSNRSLSSLTGDTRSNPNLWRWDGQGGIRQGLLSSLVTFGTLKGAGRLAQGENVVVQHLLQDTGMVLGHQVSGALGITQTPTGSLAEQFLHAEVTNLQLSAGMAFAHGLTPQITSLERGLDLSLRSSDSEGSGGLEGLRRLLPQPAFATNGREVRPDRADTPSEEGKGPTILQMANEGESGGGSKPPEPKKTTSISSLFRRVLQIPEREVMKEALMALYSSLTGPAQRVILEALDDLENSRPVSPFIQRILKNPQIRQATFLSSDIQREIEQRLELLNKGEGDFDAEPPTGPNRSKPTPLGFKRMVVDLGVEPSMLAQILNRINFPSIDLSFYPSYDGEPIYINGDEDFALLQQYAKLDYQSLGEAIFFARRELSRNWNRAEASEQLQISIDDLTQLEENESPPTPHQIDRLVQVYPIHRGLLEKIASETRYGVAPSPDEGQSFTSPVSPSTPGSDKTHGVPVVPNLSSETVYTLNAKRLQNLARMVQDPEMMWPFSPKEVAHELLGLATFFERDASQSRKQSDRDHLTGMLNRNGLSRLTPRLESRLSTDHRRSNDNGKSDWVLMVDIDHFKRINDTYLHQNGDKVLVEVSSIILKQLGRLHDIGARWGGEEFFLWLGTSGQQGALRVAEAIRSAVEGKTIQINGYAPIQVTVSIGLAEMRALPHPDKAKSGELVSDGSLENAIDRADRALYEAKRTGRNRVILSHE
jgi:diguanylate cyclase (GGDEF)-like protein